MPSAEGVVVLEVADGSLAQQSRLPARRHDRSRSTARRSPTTRDLDRVAKAASAGVWRITIERGGQQISVDRSADERTPRPNAARDRACSKPRGSISDAPRPLADRLRPQKLAEVVGQDHLLGPDGALTRMLESALARLADLLGTARHRQDHGRAAAGATRPSCISSRFRAVFSGVADLKKAFEAARARRETGQGTLLFVDEMHRFNRAQQDSFLPVMEDGTVVLVGATTENPSFELNARAAVARARAGVQVARRRGDREAAGARRGDRGQASCRSTPRRARR